MSGDTGIRHAKPEDVRQLAALAAETFTSNFGYLYKAEALRQHLEKTCSERFFLDALAQGDAVFLAYHTGKLAGYAKAGKLGLPVAPMPPSASEIHRLYVTEPFHKKGIGHALMQAVMDVPAVGASSSIYLGVWENNHRAQRFYSRYGFTPVGEYKYYVGDHADREIIMRRDKE